MSNPLQLAWLAAFFLYLLGLVRLWSRPVPPATASGWSFEALNLLVGQLLVVALYGLLELNVGWQGKGFGVALAAWAVAWWLAYWGLRWAHCRGDRLLLPMACLLSGIGWIEQLRLNPHLASQQIRWILLGISGLVLICAYLRDLSELRRRWPLLLALAVLLQCGLFWLGQERNGAALWYSLGPYSFQPVEVVKVLVCSLLATLLAPGLLHRSVLACLGSGWLALEALLVAQRDLGMALLFFGVFLGSLYLVSGRLLWIVGLTALSGLGALGAFIRFDHVRVRVEAWLDPLAHFNDSGYQISQALFALAAGGWTGKGLGLGQPLLIPEAATDFIFVAWCEEMGALGGGLLWALLTMFLLRCLRSAQTSRHAFERLLAFALAFLLSWQSTLVLFGTLKMMPMTGITLPFISYGGSSMLSNFLILALLQRMSQRSSEAK